MAIRKSPVLALFAAAMAPAGTAQTGTPLAPWTRGTLDIHQISTGRGNSALFVLSYGTRLVVVSGGGGDGGAGFDRSPSGVRRPGEWVSRYIHRHLSADLTALD